jgi:hypothetical protein
VLIEARGFGFSRGRDALRAAAAVAWCAICSWAAGCSGDDVPIGGPHGGATRTTVGPTSGAPWGDLDSSTAADGVTGEEGGSSVDGAGASNAPPWSTLFSRYFTTCKTCHVQMAGARSGYLWLRSQGFIQTPNPSLVDPSLSCLSWYGGNMPPGGGSNAAAVADMDAWAAVGALDN